MAAVEWHFESDQCATAGCAAQREVAADPAGALARAEDTDAAVARDRPRVEADAVVVDLDPQALTLACMRMHAWRAPAWRMTFASAACTTRNTGNASSVGMGGGARGTITTLT